jgi:hypothetical protein
MARPTVGATNVLAGDMHADSHHVGYLIAEPEAGFTRTLFLV